MQIILPKKKIVQSNKTDKAKYSMILFILKSQLYNYFAILFEMFAPCDETF